MKKIFTTAVTFSLLLNFVSAQNIDPEWVRFETTSGNDAKVFIDAEGNFITLGETYMPGPGLGMITIKYDAHGNLLWKNKYDTFVTEFIQDCVIDNEGSVYSTCSSFDQSVSYARFALVKYSTDGDTVWTFYYGGADAITNSASDLMVADDGNILVAGSLNYLIENDFGLMLLKISPAGQVLWQAIYTDENYGFSSLGVRQIDGVYYVWGRRGSAEGIRFCCMKVDMEGNILDFNLTPPYGDYFSSYYTIDRKGNFLVGDHCCQYKLTKYSASGDSLWQYIKPVEPDTFAPNVAVARLTSVDVDSANNVYAVGPYYNDPINRIVILTTKFDESGVILWQKPLISNYAYGSYPEQIKISDQNRVFIAGQGGFVPPQSGSELLLLEYDLEGNLIRGGISDIEGEKNGIRDLAVKENVISLAGVWNPPSALDATKLITTKYNLPTSFIVPVSGIDHSSLSVIPNPFRDYPNLLVSHEGSSTMGTLEMSDAQGRLLHRQEVFLLPGDNFLAIDRSDALPPGVYYFQVRTEKKTYASKAIKNRL